MGFDLPTQQMIAAQAVLDCPLDKNHMRAETIREFFRLCLRELWAEDEGFSGKRPLGNSGWKSRIESALVVAKLVPGKTYLDELDAEADDPHDVDAAILTAIDTLFA